ncbi:MAG: site-2 protease family protein [Planctomycetota bacterium]
MDQNDTSGTTEAARITMDPQVVFTRRAIGGRITAVAHHSGLGKFFQLGTEEFRIAQLLDGNRTLNEIIQILQSEGIEWTPRETAEFIARLVAARLAHPMKSPDVPDTSDQTSESLESEPSPKGRPLLGFLKALSFMISQRIPLFRGDPVAAYLSRKLGGIFSVSGTIWGVLLIASGLLIVTAKASEFSTEIRRMFDPSIWIVLIVMWVVAKAVHELGHAVAARYHGVRVGKMGIMFFLFAPLAYVDVTGAWKLRNRFSRVQIALAGIYIELMIAAMCAWAWLLLPDGWMRHLAAQLFVVAGPATLLVNANPLLRLDGYYVLSDLTEIPNLRMHGRRQLVGLIERVLFAIKPQRPLLMGWRRKFATFHAACSVIFQIVWMAGLVVGISMWARGLGIFITFAAVLLWALIPLLRWIQKIWTIDGDDRWVFNSRRKRLVTFAVILMIWGVPFFAGASPFARRVPVVVQFREEQIARACADAFVHTVFVKSGQRVEKGTLLLELRDPELSLQRDEKEAERKIAELKAIQFRRQGDVSRSAAESENAASLSRQIAELDEQLAGLQVIAERHGIVYGSELDSLLGRFCHRGDELLRVSDPQEKELLTSVSESDLQAYQAAAQSGQPASIRLRGGTVFETVPASLRPRARRSLPHPALAATAGGPLAVEQGDPSDQESLRVIEPQLQSRTPLDPVTSAELNSGQLGMMTIKDNRSLFTRLITSLKSEE